MLDILNKGKGELLSFLFKNPDKEFYLTEIAKNLNKAGSYYQRYLDSFVKDGVLVDERKGNLRFFRLNKKHPLYEDLKSIISKSFGAESKLKELISKFDGIEIAFIFGSIANNKENVGSDIDLMLIGEVNQDLLIKEVNELEGELNREINYHVYKKDELIKKIKEKNSFIINVITSPLITIKGNAHGLTKLITK